MISDYSFQFFGTVPSYCLHHRMFFLYGLGRYIRWQFASRCNWSDMHNTLIIIFLRVNKSVLSLHDLFGVWTIYFRFFLKLYFHSSSEGLISNNFLFSLLFQRCCLCCSMYLTIFILKSVCGCFIWSVISADAIMTWDPTYEGLSISFQTFFYRHLKLS